jgi:competence protein ComEC
VLSDNDRSCVLRVSAAGGPAGASGPRSLLLTGDVEAFGEAVLLAGGREAVQADIVLAPHHGSRTSSTPAFVQATGARWVVVQAGYRSRFGHPAPDVVARWRDAGARVVDTPSCGAWSWAADTPSPVCERARSRRHWQHPGGAP